MSVGYTLHKTCKHEPFEIFTVKSCCNEAIKKLSRWSLAVIRIMRNAKVESGIFGSADKLLFGKNKCARAEE